MAVRDAGWIQLFAETNQEAADLHIVAFRLAEALSLPVMVCMDGFILTHAVEQVELASQAQVDTFLSPYEPRQVLDPALPVSIGAMVGPEAFEEVRYLAHLRQRDALALLPTLADEFEACFGRPIGSLVTPYRCESAETIVVAMGSVLGTIKDAVDELCGEGVSIGALGITSFRPFPSAALSAALAGAARVVVLEKAFSVGFGGVLATDTAMALKDQPVTLTNIVAGLGGRPITKASLVSALAEAARGDSESLTFLDLDTELVEHERSHMDTIRQSGPIAENLLKELDTRHPAPAEYPAVPVSFTSTRPSATTSPREQT
jgi:pyruvate ferredoxin oxidoreductase alpha subunit